MAIKKSELYSSLWAGCDQLRGGMDASQYKDYVLTLLFVKYLSDKYAGKKNSEVEIPEGATFEDLVKLKGKTDIGDQINKNILEPLFKANGLERTVDFNDDTKLGSGKEIVDRLSNLIAIFENEALNFKNNRAEDDDILGDAYEYLMRHFATESGKSKGQFYTPAEVSRILSKIIDVKTARSASFTVYDPTCGSGSLLLKVVEEAPCELTIYGQEMDVATRGLAVMNMWLHGYPTAEIARNNTIAAPEFKDANGKLKRFDFVVANPPFSIKNWHNGIDPQSDVYDRFRNFGVPPEKNGDYAFLLHIVASLNSTGKGAVILPHGVLFRGNAEAEIRKNLIKQRYIKGVIGLPANLFYGTGIPACIIVIDKENVNDRTGIFMLDASKGFLKDGAKNRLRAQDVHKIVDIFNRQKETPKYARLVTFDEIEKNEFNLNIPRYIDAQEEEDFQDLNAHLNGGIPDRDVESLAAYWDVFPSLKNALFAPLRPGYARLKPEAADIKALILSHPEFTEYSKEMNAVFEGWKAEAAALLSALDANTKPKKLILKLSESLLEAYENRALIDPYDVYQYLMNYWEETLKDDVYLVIEDGWTAKLRTTAKSKKETVRESDLLPKALITDVYFADEKAHIQQKAAELESVAAEIAQLEEECAGEDGLLEAAANEAGKISRATLTKRLKETQNDPDEAEARALMQNISALFDRTDELKKSLKAAETELETLTVQKYAQLTPADVQTLTIERKWMGKLRADVQTEIDAISQRLTARVKELAERYAEPLPHIDARARALETRVTAWLEQMGVAVA